MRRREKLERIIDYYELPYRHGRRVSDIVARQPLEWFTDEQLEFIASKLVNDARFTARLNRQNRERLARAGSPSGTVRYKPGFAPGNVLKRASETRANS